jgi:uncharacterized protein (TIGR03083 family)
MRLRDKAGKGSAVDYVEHFRREVAAFETAGRVAAGPEAAPAVPSCPEWVMTDLVLHLGRVHRIVARIIGERMQEPPVSGDQSWLGLASEWRDWLPPGRAPQRSPVPAGLLDWFHAGAGDLHERFRAADPGDPVWTWWTDHTAGFWQRMQAIEAAVHRWDAENAVGQAGPIDASLATDAVGQTFQVMAPMRRARLKGAPAHGERFLFRRADGAETWSVRFEGDNVLLGTDDSHHDIQISGSASDLALFLWQRPVTSKLEIHGDTSLLSRYFALVPPL